MATAVNDRIRPTNTGADDNDEDTPALIGENLPNGESDNEKNGPGGGRLGDDSASHEFKDCNFLPKKGELFVLPFPRAIGLMPLNLRRSGMCSKNCWSCT